MSINTIYEWEPENSLTYFALYSDSDEDDISAIEIQTEYGNADIFSLPKEEAIKMANAILNHYGVK
jgi:hypothetical protein